MAIQSILYEKISSGKIASDKLIAHHFKVYKIMNLPPHRQALSLRNKQIKIKI